MRKCQLILWPINQSNAQVPADIMANVTSQLDPVRPVPKKLTDYSEEERQAFPKLFDFKENFVQT
jgi:large subunit ribosomal protein L13